MEALALHGSGNRTKQGLKGSPRAAGWLTLQGVSHSSAGGHGHKRAGGMQLCSMQEACLLVPANGKVAMLRASFSTASQADIAGVKAVGGLFSHTLDKHTA